MRKWVVHVARLGKERREEMMVQREKKGRGEERREGKRRGEESRDEMR
jgi:hypothetical protein